MRYKIRRALPVIVVAAVMCVNLAQAETAKTAADLQSNKRLAAYLWSRPMQEIFFRLGVEQDRKFGLQVDCKSQFELKPINVVILSPVELPDDKVNPTSGSWLFRYTFVRCGESKVYNAVLGATSQGGLPQYQAYYPGATNAHPILVKDTMVSAMANAIIRSDVKDCKSAEVLDMRVTESPHTVQDGGKEFKGVWGETWTFMACEKTVDVPITFTPDIGGGGTSFSIRLR
jgi:hypothetical protein